MEIGPLNRVGMGVPVNATPTSPGANPTDSQLVAAVQSMNKSELLAQDRALVYRRDPKTGHPIIQIVERESGDVVDQIPPEVILRLHDEFEQLMQAKGPQE